MADAPKSAYELAMERLRALDRESGVAEARPSEAQKREIAEARRVAAARLAEREKAEREYQIDRQRINDDSERAIEAIRNRRT